MSRRCFVAEGRFADRRLVVAHDPERAAEQSPRRRAQVAELETFADKLVAKLDAQDCGANERGRKACDRGAYSRFQQAVADARMTRFLKADDQADRFCYTLDEDAIQTANAMTASWCC